MIKELYQKELGEHPTVTSVGALRRLTAILQSGYCGVLLKGLNIGAIVDRRHYPSEDTVPLMESFALNIPKPKSLSEKSKSPEEQDLEDRTVHIWDNANKVYIKSGKASELIDEILTLKKEGNKIEVHQVRIFKSIEFNG